ncbi:MAG: ferrous iron transport protein A [Gammaproteobacteria bacterium]
MNAVTPLPQLTLDRIAPGTEAIVTDVQAPAGAADWARWLHDIGFVPGERVRLMRRAPGGDPIVLRVGTSTFALRRAEAACVLVEPAG